MKVKNISKETIAICTGTLRGGSCAMVTILPDEVVNLWGLSPADETLIDDICHSHKDMVEVSFS